MEQSTQTVSFTVQGSAEISAFLKAIPVDRYFRFEPTSRIKRPIYVINGKIYRFTALEVNTKNPAINQSFPDGKFTMQNSIDEVVLTSYGKRIVLTDSTPRVETRKSGRLVYYCDKAPEVKRSGFSIVSTL